MSNTSTPKQFTSSWADDDDEPIVPVPVVVQTPASPVREKEEMPRHSKQGHGYGDQFYDKTDGHSSRPAARREGGGDSSSRGQHHQRSYDHRPSGGSSHDHAAPRREYQERSKNPIPETGPFKCYVGNLPYNTTEGDLNTFFDGLSIKDIHLPMDFETNRPKGFAYVEFGDRQSLENAVTLDNAQVEGRNIRVDVASEKKKSTRSWEKQTSHDQAPPMAERTIKERPKFNLLPRTSSSKADTTAHVSSIFGGAKPRDENQYKERAAVEGKKQHAKKQQPTRHDPNTSPRRGDRREERRDRRGSMDKGDKSTEMWEHADKPRERASKASTSTAQSGERRRSEKENAEGKTSNGKTSNGKTSNASMRSSDGKPTRTREPQTASRKKKIVVTKTDEELMKKAHVSTQKVSTSVANPFAAFDDSSDSE